MEWEGPDKSVEDEWPPPTREAHTAELLKHLLEPIHLHSLTAKHHHHHLVQPTDDRHEPQADKALQDANLHLTRSHLESAETLLRLLDDCRAEVADAHRLVDAVRDAPLAAQRAMLVARDSRGCTSLHLAVTRGDVELCRKILRLGDGGHAAYALDRCRNTPLMLAAMAGRALIVRELLAGGGYAATGMLWEKNCDLMSALQLAVVDEAPGNGEVVRLLVEAGAPIDAPCWDVTPLMAAAASGHHWAVQTLLELGADYDVTNSAGMAALDYARDQATAQLVLDFMEGRLLRGEAKREPSGAARHHGREAKPPRAFQSGPCVGLDEAFRRLSLPAEWLEPFVHSGTHYRQVRKAWRTLVLRCHPDKRAEHSAELTAQFAEAMEAFEAVEKHYSRCTHAPRDT